MVKVDFKKNVLPKALNGDDSIDHIYCACDRNVSLCGFDITELTDYGMESDADDTMFCVVCLEVEASGVLCENCGQ